MTDRMTFRNLALLSALLIPACGRAPDVTLYVALDQEHSERLVKLFEERSGLKVNARFDTEANKTVGLTNALFEERARPRADVFWNNELAHTVRLADSGLLAPYRSPSAQEVPDRFRDPKDRWTAFAARARVLIVNTQLVPDAAQHPKSYRDLLDPRWKGRCGVARPLTGTTLTHFAALAQALGGQEFQAFLAGLKANDVELLQSNGATMRAVAEGRLAFAFTDTDDFHVAKTKGHPVAVVFPDQGEGGLGTMLIPNSVGLIANGPNPDNARKLVDFILSTEVEALLAASKAAQIPVRSGVKGPEGLPATATLKWMDWDAGKVATSLDAFAKAMHERFGK